MGDKKIVLTAVTVSTNAKIPNSQMKENFRISNIPYLEKKHNRNLLGYIQSGQASSMPAKLLATLFSIRNLQQEKYLQAVASDLKGAVALLKLVTLIRS